MHSIINYPIIIISYCGSWPLLLDEEAEHERIVASQSLRTEETRRILNHDAASERVGGRQEDQHHPL